ncbi:MAG: methyltransferase domain-containing protein [Synergistaceae bacterium]|jgi:phospholipid N-methyltransferase|nr:methyltransferase domain-containing protein [Synergistaceae bacterium]
MTEDSTVSKNGFSGFIDRRRHSLARQFLLLRELIRAPRNMGTLCASSPALSDEMVAALTQSFLKSGYLIELGAGTGPVTEALLRHGASPSRLIVIERSKALADCLQSRFSSVNVICCPAEEMRSCVKCGPVRAVVSSLPFRTLPADVSVSIMAEVEKILAPGGLFVQFTYALIGEMPFIPKSFRKLRSKVVLYNLPPAKVEVFRKPKGPGELSDRTP